MLEDEPRRRQHGARLRNLKIAALALLAAGMAGGVSRSAAGAPQMAAPPIIAVRSPSPPTSSTPISVTSATFRNGATLPAATAFDECGGRNVSPALAWRNFPAKTRSFAITVFDPDAPTGSGFWHWVVFNIPASVTRLPANAGRGATPGGGASGYTDYGFSHYGGPCPPPGDPPHRYVFTVYALDVPRLDGVSAATTGASVVFSMRGHLLAQGSIVGRYGR